MDLDELDNTDGGKRRDRPCCVPLKTPVTGNSANKSHDGHMGAVETDTERWSDFGYGANGERRDYYGFLLPHRTPNDIVNGMMDDYSE